MDHVSSKEWYMKQESEKQKEREKEEEGRVVTWQ